MQKFARRARDILNGHWTRLQHHLLAGDEGGGQFATDPYYTAAGICGLILAWAAQPLLRFAQPSFTLGICGAICFVILLATVARGTGPRRARAVAALAAVVMATYVTIVLCQAMVTLQARADNNERLCQIAQRDLLSPKPKRADEAAIIQVLGCRPVS